MARMSHFCRQWRLRPSASKTISSVFHLHNTSATHEKIVKHDSWPIQPDILSPPLLRLTSRKPLWLDLQPVDNKDRWGNNWKSAQVINSHLVCDPTIPQPGFNLPRQQWALLNRFRTEQGHCGKTPTMFHIVEYCPLTKLNGSLSRLHSVDDDAVSWLTSYGSWHAYEKNKKRLEHCASLAQIDTEMAEKYDKLGKTAKLRMISEEGIRFLDPDYDPDRAQKLISSSMSRHLLTRNISSMHVFLSNLAHRQTDRQTSSGVRAACGRWNSSCICISLCKTVVHSRAQNSTDNLPSSRQS